MVGLKQRLLGLCVPPLLLCLLDWTLTLLGQSADYWAGYYAIVDEGSPTFHQLLQAHPAAFMAGVAAEIVVLFGLVLLLPDTLALVVSIAASFGHTLGAATWLLYRFHYGYHTACWLILLSAILVGVGIRWGWRALPEREYRPSWLPSFVRWGLASVLFGVTVYVSLWPRHPIDDVADDEITTKAVEATVSTDQELERLARTPDLTVLCLSGTQITSAGLDHLKQFDELESLVIRGLPLTGSDLDNLQGLGSLKSLYFDNVSIPDGDLKHLAGFTQLEGMTLHGPQVTDAWLEPLKGLSQLQYLDLVGTRVTDAGLAHLDGLNRLEGLDLAGTFVTSDGLQHLKGLSQLRRLIVVETKITDAGLEHLKGLTRLEELYLRTTNCTPEGEKKFQQSLPKCRIVK
ncbi:MAG: hypothetical protein NTW96_19395 [Planctomycetia bacterium]|nr:hypothetical protein [Planctomycetia bacterium]